MLLSLLPKSACLVRVLSSHRLRDQGWRSLVTSASKLGSQHRVILLPEIPMDNAATNPVLQSFKDGLPKLANLSEKQCYYGLGKALLEFESRIGEIESKIEEGQAEFEEIYGALEKAKCQFESVWNAVNLCYIAIDIMDKDRYIHLHKRAERAYASKIQSKTIFNYLVKVKKESATNGKLDAKQLRLIDKHLLEGHHQGLGISEESVEYLSKISATKMLEARRDYRYRHMMATKAFSMTLRDPNLVRDFPLDVLRAMAKDSQHPTNGPWSLSLHPYLYRKFLEYCPNRSRRWSLYLAKQSGGPSAHTNIGILAPVKDMRLYRHEMATILGYNNFAEVSMATKMAGNVENVHSMIASLLPKAREGQEKELEELQKFAESKGFEDNLSFFDVPYYTQLQRASMIGAKDEELRDFFPLPRVVTGVFKLCQDLFDIVFEEVKEDVDTWAPNVKLYRMSDRSSGKVIGHFYFDPYIRDDKGYSGGDRGWYIPLRPVSGKAGCQPVGAMLHSFPVPGYGKPSLLSFDEVRELFRNMGSMFLHLLSTNEWSDLNGKTCLAWDVIDVPSNFLIHWLHTPKVLQMVSGHWSSNEPLSKEIIESLCLSKQHMAGFSLCDELFRSSYDIAFYSRSPEEEDFKEITDRLYPEYHLLPMEKQDVFPLQFEEIMGGDHPAAYYCSTWAKMVAADAFSAVLEVGLDNPEEVKKVTKRFRETILSMGSALPAAEVFRQFRGRDPSHEALLVSLGLKAIAKPKQKGLHQ